MQLARFDDLLRLGPSEHILFERDAASPAHIARLIASLANTHGGTIVFGVQGARTIKGVRSAKAALAKISRAAELVMPAVLLDPQTVAVGEQTVVLLDVPQGSDPPYTTADGLIPLRSGARSKAATREQAAELAQRAVRSAVLVPLDAAAPNAQRLQPKSAGPAVDLDHIMLKLERLIIANAELARKLDNANSWQSRLTDQLLGAVLGLIVSTLVFYILGIG